MLLRCLKIVLSCCLLNLATVASGQVFTFQCVCAQLDGDSCDVCPGGVIKSRSFTGLLIYKSGVPYRWIDQPYTIRVLAGETVQFLEQANYTATTKPDDIRIARYQTPFATIAGFVDSTNCFCNGGGEEATVEVDTPIIGNGSPGSPLTIGQFGADTTMYLRWNGHHWYPSPIRLSDIVADLPYYTGDTAAIAAGLLPGDPYLLECHNDYDLPAGIYKVVKICGYDCAMALHYYADDSEAISKDVPVGKEYVLDEHNLLGILNGFVKAVTNDTLSTGTLTCSTSLPSYNNDAAAISGGLTSGNYYYLTTSNTLGYPYGTKKRVL